jgi:hypothetical protein
VRPWGAGIPRIGVEVELMAPRGASRRDLAAALAGPRGTVTPFLHPDSEPSKVPGQPVFHNLTQGFRAAAPDGREVARTVDDITLQDDLDATRPPRPGWWRVVSDDRRVLHLARRHGRADDGPRGVLEPLAALFGVPVEALPGGILRVRDPDGMPVALGAALPGERERACEVVTPPLGPFRTRAAAEAALDAVLAPARALGFTIPVEAAVHVHLDAAPLRDAAMLQAFVRRMAPRLPALRERVATNPRCRRLGPWPADLLDTVEAPDFASLGWDAAAARLQALRLSKYVDLNLRNVVHDVAGKPTLELRVLPGAIDAAPVLDGLEAFLDLLDQG